MSFEVQTYTQRRPDFRGTYRKRYIGMAGKERTNSNNFVFEIHFSGTSLLFDWAIMHI